MLWGVGCQPGISSPVRLCKEQRECVYVLRDEFWGEAKGLEGCYVYVCRVWLCVSDRWVLRSVIRQTRPRGSRRETTAPNLPRSALSLRDSALLTSFPRRQLFLSWD